LLVTKTGPDGKKYVAVGCLSQNALRKYEENILDQMKPENATLLLEESSDVAVIEEDKLKLPAPDEE
jgi:hypothetical protein